MAEANVRKLDTVPSGSAAPHPQTSAALVLASSRPELSSPVEAPPPKRQRGQTTKAKAAAATSGKRPAASGGGRPSRRAKSGGSKC